jgi:hypothetical protein
MGLAFRADRMLRKEGLNEEMKDHVRGTVKRLVGTEDGDMGRVYNVLGISARDKVSEGFNDVTSP